MANSKLITIVPNGDAILVCSDGDSEKRFQVSLTVLRIASPVLAAYINPNVGEGSRLHDRAEPASVSLREDQPAAMLPILAAMHCRNDLIVSVPDIELLRSIASTCNKYKCNTALTMHVKSWSDHHAAEAEDCTLISLLEIACMMGIAGSINSLAVALVMIVTGPMGDTYEIDEAIPQSLIEQIDEQGVEMRQNIRDAVDGQIYTMFRQAEYPSPRCVSKCNAAQTQTMLLMKSFDKIELIPTYKLTDDTLQDLKAALDQADFSALEATSACGGQTRTGCILKALPKAAKMNEELKALSRNMMQALKEVNFAETLEAEAIKAEP